MSLPVWRNKYLTKYRYILLFELNVVVYLDLHNMQGAEKKKEKHKFIVDLLALERNYIEMCLQPFRGLSLFLIKILNIRLSKQYYVYRGLPI